MRGDPWGHAKRPKWAKMANSGKIGINGKNKSNGVRTIDAFSLVLIIILLLVYVLE